MKTCTHDSSTVKVTHMKEVIASKKKSQAAKDGLDPDTVECKVSTRHAKINMVAAAATSNLSFSKKKLLIIHVSKHARQEHTKMGKPMMALINACYVLV